MPYAAPMQALFDSLWRAAAYCVHPRVILWSLLPLLLAVALVLGLGWLYWAVSVAAMQAFLDQWAMVMRFVQWLDSLGMAGLAAALAPLIVVLLVVPVVVVLSLLLVAWLMTPSMVTLVEQRRFPQLQRKRGAGWWQSALRSLGLMALALLLLVLSLPLWLIPPLALLLPPLIWGWLTYKVMSFDVLAGHASSEERRQLTREQHWPLLAIGVVTGYLGAAPSLLWAISAATLVLAPVLVVLSVWLYTLVFAFSSLWFAHFALAALQRLRQPLPIEPLPMPAALALPQAVDRGALPALPPP
jgi:Etoposide-induced protein 2.4 (EI24)